MANPSYRSSSSNISSGTTNPTVPLPAGTVNGDFLIACITSNQAINGSPVGWLQQNQATLTGAVNSQIYYKVASGEPATLTWQLAVAGASLIQVVCVQNGQALDGATAFGFNGTPINIVEAQSVTPTQAHDLLVGFFIISANTTFTPDPAMTEVQDQPRLGVCTMEAAVQTLTAAGSTGPRDATAGASGVSLGWLGAVRGALPAIFNASATITTAATASLTTSIRLNAAATVTVVTSATLSTSVLLNAAATVTLQSSAALKTSIELQATALIAIQSSAALTVGVLLGAASTVTFQSSAALTTGALLDASSLITFQSTADLAVGARFSAVALITLQSAADLSAGAAGLAADALITILSTAQLTVGALLSATALITVSSTADLTVHPAIVLAADALISIRSRASLTTQPLVPEVSRRGERQVRFHPARDAIAQPKQARVQVQAHGTRLSYQKLQFNADPAVLQATVEVGGSASQVTVSTCSVDAYPQAAHVDTSASTVTVRTVQNLTDEELLAVSIAARRRKQKSTQADNPRRK